MTVSGTGAAAAPSGTVAFVVVTNDSTPRLQVVVSVSAASSNGGAPVTGQTVIGSLAANETEGATVNLPVPANDSVGAVTGHATGSPSAAGSINPVTVAGASFAENPIAPTVDVTVSATAAATVVVLAVCYQGSTVVGGGMKQTIAVHPGGATTLRLAAALVNTPTTCRGFAYRA